MDEEYGYYQDDDWDDDYDPEWYDDYDPEWYEDYEVDEPEPRPLTTLERIDQWFRTTRIGRAWHVLVARPVDVDDIPF